MDLTVTLRELAQQQVTGRLIVRLPGSLGSIYLKVGEVVHATLGVTKGLKALSLILQETSRHSEFRANLTSPEVTIQAPLESLLKAPEPVVIPSLTRPSEGQSAEPQGAVQLQGHFQGQTRGQLSQVIQPSLQSLPVGEGVPAGFTNDLAKVLVDIMGPIGNIVLEDAQTDLNLADDMPRSEVQTLIAELIQQLKLPARQHIFQQKVDALRARYGLR